MNGARLLVVVTGVALPYMARWPGVIIKGPEWFGQYLQGGMGGMILLGFFNALCWGGVLLGSLCYRHPRSVWFPLALGFALPAYGHATVDLSADAQAAVALVFIPIYSLPLVLLGWLLGLWYDRTRTVNIPDPVRGVDGEPEGQVPGGIADRFTQ